MHDRSSISETSHRSRSPNQEDQRACQAGEVNPARAHLYATHLVGSTASRSMQGSDLCGSLAGPGGPALPGIVQSRGQEADGAVLEPD